MPRFIVFGLLILCVASAASAQQSDSIFRNAFKCPDKGPTSICVFGTIPKGRKVTIIVKDRTISATPAEEFPNTEFDNGFSTITRLEATKPLARELPVIAVLAPAESVKLVPQIEYRDDKVVRATENYWRKVREVDREPYRKYSVSTRLIKLAPSIIIAETKYTSHIEMVDPRNGKLLTICAHCDDGLAEFLVRADLVDLFKGFRRQGDNFCGGLVSAFELFGRLHILSKVDPCESDAGGNTLIHDISGSAPRLVFK
jgi:hypothetical protein